MIKAFNFLVVLGILFVCKGNILTNLKNTSSETQINVYHITSKTITEAKRMNYYQNIQSQNSSYTQELLDNIKFEN